MPIMKVQIDSGRIGAGDHEARSCPCDRMGPGPSSQAVLGEAPMARKDKGGKSSKKAASRSLKEKRQAKRDKKATKPNTREPL